MQNNSTIIDLLSTERGQKWLEQFDPNNREEAENLIKNLTLVSHNEFERSIKKILESNWDTTEPIAFYAIREIDNKFNNYFEQPLNSRGNINALNSGTNHGSEAIIANIIRNFCEINPKQFFNHPTLKTIKDNKCRSIIMIDDFIGTGDQANAFISSFWNNKTIKSWHSRKYTKFIIFAYSITDKGKQKVEKHSVSPEIIVERRCPSIDKMPYNKNTIEKIKNLCEVYGKKTCKKKLSLGYKNSMASIIFEHRCPNNVPAILWAEDSTQSNWKALFPHRNIMSETQSIFPEKVISANYHNILREIGQRKLAQSSALERRGDTGKKIIIILALIARGIRRKSALSFATGLNERDCAKILIKCMKWDFITHKYRITNKGKAELKYAKKSITGDKKTLPKRGENYYYPKQLRSITNG